MLWAFLIEKIPGDAEVHDGTVNGVVGGKEGVLAGHVACYVVPHDEEAGSLQVHVGVDVDEGVVAQGNAAVGDLLHGILIELWTEVGGFVLGEEGAAGTELDAEYTGNLETEVEVGE